MEEDVIDNRNIKDFMEWFVSEYDGHWLPSDLTPTINRLEGYVAAKEGSPECYIVSKALSDLIDFQTLLRIIKQNSNWKYRG